MIGSTVKIVYPHKRAFYLPGPRSPISKNFILTLGVGITFGFCFAYMLLNVSGGGASTEYFIQRTPQAGVAEPRLDSHGHGDGGGGSHGHAHSHDDMEKLDDEVPEFDAEQMRFHRQDEWTHKGGKYAYLSCPCTVSIHTYS